MERGLGGLDGSTRTGREELKNENCKMKIANFVEFGDSRKAAKTRRTQRRIGGPGEVEAH
jgi:hypothetical protein